MSAYGFTGDARDDLNQLLLHLTSSHDAKTAASTKATLYATFKLLAQFPGMGHRRHDLTNQDFRFFPSRPYLIAYEPQDDMIVIHAVLHSSRNLRKVFALRAT